MISKKHLSAHSVVMFDPHPDDADWWTGGLTLLLRRKGWDVHYICVGPTTRTTRQQAQASARVLGVQRHFLEIPFEDGAIFRQQLKQTAPKLLLRLDPDLVFIPPVTDYHYHHVLLARELFALMHWSAGHGLGGLEIYEYDSSENRNPIDCYLDISAVWNRHLKSLRCHRIFERSSIPDNTLVRIKTGRAMILGAALPVGLPVLYAEGYRLLQGKPKIISSLPKLLPEEFFFRATEGLLRL